MRPMANGFVLTTPEQIHFWVWTSRMSQLALELNTDMKHRAPILASMYYEGLIDAKLTGTRKNKLMVLKAMVEATQAVRPDWTPPFTIAKALEET